MRKNLNKERYTLRIDRDVWSEFNTLCEKEMIQKNLLIEKLIKEYLITKKNDSNVY